MKTLFATLALAALIAAPAFAKEEPYQLSTEEVEMVECLVWDNPKLAAVNKNIAGDLALYAVPKHVVDIDKRGRRSYVADIYAYDRRVGVDRANGKLPEGCIWMGSFVVPGK